MPRCIGSPLDLEVDFSVYLECWREASGVDDEAAARPPREDPTMAIDHVADDRAPELSTCRMKIGLLPEPDRTASGYRDYPIAAVDRVRFIRTAQTVGLALDEIGEILDLRDRGHTPCTHVRHLIRKHATELEERIGELQRMRSELQLLADIEDDTSDTASHCHIIEHAGIDRSDR